MYRAKKKLVFLLAIFTVIVFIFFINASHVFYNYQISFHGLPGSYLAARTPNESFCNYRYGLPEELLYEESDLVYPPEENLKSSYKVLVNVIEAKFNNVPEVTFATHTTVDFLNYLAEIVRFWEGPVSLAIFVPDSDADLTIRHLDQLCSCVPEMTRVSVHFVFPRDFPPYLQNSQVYSYSSCIIPDSSKISTFRNVNQMVYPINVCRNIARSYSQTDLVMVTDIQLIPSAELALRFSQIRVKKAPSQVFVVPVFEVEAFDVIPRIKSQLVLMLREQRAVYFHRYVCSHCQKFPGIKSWIDSDPGDSIRPLLAVKREYPFHRWEPVYIGGKNDPLFSEVLSWEGLQDKMTQMLEMCLIGYQFVILDGAFLVHWPGIKKPKSILNSYWRTSFRKQNSQHYSRIIGELREKYGENPKCKL